MRITLVHNPEAGDGRPQGADLVEILSGAGLQVRYVSSKKNWKKALDEETDLVVAAGGDGTVAKVLLEMRGRDVPAAMLPLGTANNIARTLGVLGDARAIAAAWRVEAARPFDLGLLRASWGETRMLEAFGGGIFAETIRRGEQEVEDPSAIVGPETDRAILLLREIVSLAKPNHWRLELDGEDLSGDYLAVEAMNIRFAGPNIPLAPEAHPGDGLLDVVLIGPAEREALIGHLTDRLSMAAAEPPDLPVKRGRRLRVTLDRPYPPLHLDDDLLGEDIGTLPEDGRVSFELEIEPAAVSLLGAHAHVTRQS